MPRVLISVGGLPATGKTTLGRAVARELGGVHLRVDTIEQAVVRSGLAAHPVGPVGYAVGYALAEEQLGQGLTVVAESVNPLAVTRDAWRDVALRAGARLLEVETVCSDRAEHRRRAVERTVDIPDLPLPTWEEITGRSYEPWDRDRLVVDTAAADPGACVRRILAAAGF